MSLKGVDIQKGEPGANTNLGADSTSALIGNGIAVATKLVLDTVYTLFQPKDAEDLGVDAAYDADNNVVLYRHITEFYRKAGKGVKLFLMVVDQTVTMTEMVEDLTSIYCRKMIAEAQGEIRNFGVCLNPVVGYIPTYLDGLDDDVRAAIPKAQLLHDWSYETFRPCSIFLEGRDYNNLNAAAALDLKNIPDTEAQKVSLVIGQDWDYADGLHAISQVFADVGNFLGCIASRKVNENPGEVETMNITDSTLSVFLTGGISDHTKIKDIEADWETLDTKGYIFPIYYTGASGLRWNDDHVCVSQVVDEDGYFNEFSVALGRTLDKAARVLRAALLPKVKSVQPVDGETGKLPLGIIKWLEGIGDRAFERMQEDAEISAGQTTIDPDSDIVTGDQAVLAEFVVVPYGTIKEIKGVINLKKSL